MSNLKDFGLKDRRDKLKGYLLGTTRNGKLQIWELPYKEVCVGLLLNETPKQIEERVRKFYPDTPKYKTVERYVNEMINVHKGKVKFEQRKF